MNRFCTDCGRRFDALGDWQRRCKDCYRDHKHRELAGAYDEGYSRGYADGIRHGESHHRHAAQPALPSFSVERLRALVQLTHPDRHPPERAELANRATAHLLDLMGRAAG